MKTGTNGMINLPALLNAICELYPEYAAIHNEKQIRNEQSALVQETPGVRTEFIRW